MNHFKFKTEPWNHQLEALSYLCSRSCAALYTDMGTGKTKIMIDLIRNKGFKRTIVVAPKKACDVWSAEIKRHAYKKEICIVNLHLKSTIEKVNFMENIVFKPNFGNGKQIIFIVNYDSIWREPFSKKLLYKKCKIDCLICDESHRIKSPSSRVSRYLFKLSKVVKNKYLVTGTPLAENPSDVYAQYRVLDPEIFGLNYGNFKEEYEVVDIALSTRLGFRMLDKHTPYKNLDVLKEKMFSCAFYAKSSVKLPKQLDITVPITLSKSGMKVYNQIKSEGAYICDEGFMEVANALSLVTKLQQITSGYLKLEDDDKNFVLKPVDNSKTEALKEILESVDEPVVVFALYRSDLNDIRECCKLLGTKYFEVSGSEDTLALWKKYPKGVLGVQYSSGSESIDLTLSRYCIYYSHPLSLGLYKQSRKRIHRPGQTRNTTYYHLVAKGTIDEKLIKALKTKQDIIDIVMKEGV